MAFKKNRTPKFPVATDSWRMRGVTTMATIISTTAPQRSERGARLKNAHQTTIPNPPKNLLPDELTSLVPRGFAVSYYLFVTNSLGTRRISLFAIGQAN